LHYGYWCGDLVYAKWRMCHKSTRNQQTRFRL